MSMIAAMRYLPLVGHAPRFEGAVSLEVTDEGVRPWRLPVGTRDLFEPAVLARAATPSGVRLTLVSDTSELVLRVTPTPTPDATWTFDLCVDGVPHQRVIQRSGESFVRFRVADAMPGRPRLLEVYLPSQYLSLQVRACMIDDGASVQPHHDPRRRWVVYGSSITHAKEAAGPSETWPALVARKFGLHLTSLGFGGQEHLEPSVAMAIRDLDADLISLCVGGNVWGGATLTTRTYRAAVIGMVRVIRERHQFIPIAVVSFIWAPADDNIRNSAGLTVADYRRMTTEAVDALRRSGDANVHAFDGAELYPPQLACHMPDGVHPDAYGQRVLAARYSQIVMPRLLEPPSSCRPPEK